MFERFTKDARAVVIEAQRVAREQQSAEIDPLHVLASLIRFPESGAGAVLDGLGVSSEDLAAELARVRRRGGVTEADAAALGELGIDVDRIVERIEEEHGPNALAERRGGRSARGHIPFTDESKKTLERTLREVVSLGDRQIGTEHILLALATLRGPAADVLAAHGVDPVTVRQALTRRQAS